MALGTRRGHYTCVRHSSTADLAVFDHHFKTNSQPARVREEKVLVLPAGGGQRESVVGRGAAGAGELLAATSV